MGELWRLRDNPDWQEYKDVNDVLNRIYDEEATQARREKGITQAEDDAEADRLFKQLEALASILHEAPGNRAFFNEGNLCNSLI